MKSGGSDAAPAPVDRVFMPWTHFGRTPPSAGALLCLLLALPATAVAGSAAPPMPERRPGALVQPIPTPASRPLEPLSPLEAGEKPSTEESAASREKCLRANHLVQQANNFQDESPIAFRYYEEALDLCPGHPEGNFRLAVLAYHKKDTETALKLLARAVRSAPGLVDGYYNLGIVYRLLKKPKAAKGFFERAARLDPNDAVSLYNLGVLQHRDSERSIALQTFRQAVKADPKLAEAHFFIGAILQEQGYREEAKKALQESLLFNPDLALPRVYLSAILEAEGEMQAARAELKQALKLKPEAVEVSYGYEEFYFGEGGKNVLLTHLRKRLKEATSPPVTAAELPSQEKTSAPATPKKAAAAPDSAPKDAKKGEAEASEKTGLGPRREAREVSPVTAPKVREAKRASNRPKADDTKSTARGKSARTARASSPRTEKDEGRKTKNGSPAMREYRVRPGETLLRIALRHGTTLSTLMRLNRDRIEHPNRLQAGTLIRLPPPSSKK